MRFITSGFSIKHTNWSSIYFLWPLRKNKYSNKQAVPRCVHGAVGFTSGQNLKRGEKADESLKKLSD
jgi:hypothetical protein